MRWHDRRLPPGIAAVALLVAVVPLLIWTGELALALFPVSVAVAVDDTSVAIEVERQIHVIHSARPLTALRLPPAGALHREYQVDGSDTTNNFTLDPAYFAGFAASPYYRLQAFLRDESSYSRWENLTLSSPSGQVITRESRPPDGSLLMLPAAFQMSIDLHRIETPRSIAFTEQGGGQLQIELNRNDRVMSVSESSAGGSPLELTRWFFPTDWRPPLAELVALWLRTTAIGIALVLLLVPVVVLFPRRRITLPDWRLMAVPGVLALVAALIAVGFSAGVFDRAPHVLDAVSYYFQAKVFASGTLTAPAPPVKDAFPTAFTVVHQGRWFSQYPPGTAAILALGFLARLPWLIEPLLAGGAVLLTFGIARRQFGSKSGVLAAALMATSPFLALQAGSFLSHVPAMFFAALCLYGATRYLQQPAFRWALLGAAALGLVFLSRELDAVLIGIPLGGMLAYRALPPSSVEGEGRDGSLLPPRGGLHLAAAAGFLLAALVVYGLYDLAVTGSAFEIPRQLLSPTDRLGFGTGIGFYGRHTLAAGLVNTDELLTSLNITLFGWPFGISLALMALPFILRRPAAWEVLHGSIVAAFILAYVAYFYHGIALGPRYYFVALPSMAILAARGFVAMAATASSLVDRFRLRAGPIVGENAALVLVGALLACNLIYFLPRQVELYRDYSGMPGRDGPRLTGLIRYNLSGREPALTNALVMTSDWWIYQADLAALNCPRLDCPAVFALASSPATTSALRRAFPGRRPHTIQQQGNRLIAVPEEGS